MSYLKDFTLSIESQNTSKLLELWEEYCSSDCLDVEEFVSILEVIEKSPLASFFAPYVDLSLPLVLGVEDFEKKYDALRKVIDVQSSNSDELAELSLEALKEKYGSSLNDTLLRKVGLQPVSKFQKALSSIDLLLHLKPGKCVYHHGGWGTAEIMEVSPIMERITLECEYASGEKHLSFDNALKTLTPLSDEHFLSKRFAEPDQFEKEAKKDPIFAIKLLLKDLGEKTAAEIKDELCELVIPEEEWTRWWQSARSKIKKDTSIEYPNTVKKPFRLRNKSLSHEERFQNEIHAVESVIDILQTSYHFARDFPSMIKNHEVRQTLINKLTQTYDRKDALPHQKLQILIFLEDLLGENAAELPSSKEFLSLFENTLELIGRVEILSFKKRALALLKETKEQWVSLYKEFLCSPSLTVQLKDYLLQVLLSEKKDVLENYLQNLFTHPEIAPETFIWYFQKIYNNEDSSLPYADKEGLRQGLETFFLLLSQIEFDPNYKDLTKKMHINLSQKRFEMVRSILDGASLSFVRELLLVSSKCHSLTDHDKKILHSLAQVVHPQLGTTKKIPDQERFDGSIFWTSQEGFIKSRDRAEKIATVEIIENAKEVEEARALGDLRENSEYKFAVEKRRHLQAELKRLGDLLNRARIITPDDVDCQNVGIGNIVTIENSAGEQEKITILGPWDTNPEENILSFQSKLAQSICGKKVEDTFQFKDMEYQIKNIESIFPS